MIVTEGGRFGGYGLFLSKGEFGIRPGQGGVPLQPARPQAHRVGRARAGARQAHHRLRLQVRRPGPGQGRHRRALRGRQGSGHGTPWSTRTPITFPEDETFDVGLDTRTGVALVEYRYDSPFKFTGKIDKLTFKLGWQ